MSLEAKKIVVTGAFGALGTTVSTAARAAGAQVACIDIGAIAKAPAELASCVVLGEVQLGSTVAASDALVKAAQQLGGLDGLVNIAGGFRWEQIEGDVATWDLLFNLNVRTAVNASRAALPLINRGRGRIVNIGAACALRAGVGMGPYAASKAGVAKLTEALAEEIKETGITVNAVLPSILDTPANRAAMPTADFSTWVRLDQVADLIMFLLSDRASAINGALIPIVGRV